MKRFYFVIICVFLLFSTGLAGGCHNEEGLTPYVSELRSDIFYGETKNYKVKAAYGFCEEPFTNDGAVGERVYKLIFKLVGETDDEVLRKVAFSYKEESYKGEFAYNATYGCLAAETEIENFTEKEFVVEIFVGATKESVTMKSILPENTLSYTSALKCFEEKQSDLLKTFYDENGVFLAELYVRISIKKDKPYYYVGIASGNDKLKALLLDGTNGEVLAIRNII